MVTEYMGREPASRPSIISTMANDGNVLGLEDRALLSLGQALRDAGYRFTTISPASHARVNLRPGNRWARDIADVFGWSRPFHEGLLPPALFALMRAAAVLKPVPQGFRSSVRFSTLRHRRHEELLVHSAFPTEAADAVFFGPDTYRFVRAIDETLGAEPRPLARVLDLGCGTAAAAIAIAREHPDAEVIASDINVEALRLARVNALLAGATHVIAQRSDLCTQIDGDFDLIVANPPFLLDPHRRGYRHGGGAQGEGLSLAMLDAALPRLRPGGTLLLYTGVAIVQGVDALRERLQEMLPSPHLQWRYEEIDPDIFGEELADGPHANADRIAAVVLKITANPAPLLSA